jgi:hypothetical protein
MPRMHDKTRAGMSRILASLEPVVVLIGTGTSVTSGGKTMDNLEHAVLATVKALPKLPADGPR